MGILNSVALGKSRNSAGNITFYNRIGVGCFRQKAGVAPNYKPTVAQQMQQRVFKFIKANIDASGVMALLRITYDAKPKAGKSQTMYNMFYKSYTPHIVAQKPAIYELSEDAMIDPALFIGAPAAHSDIFSNGILGALAVKSADAKSVVVDATILDNLVAKANTMLSASDVPYTINDCFVSIFGADGGSDSGYKIVFPTKVAPTLSGGAYTFDIASLTGSLSASVASYFMLTLAKSSGSAIDMTKRRFSADSIELSPIQATQVNTTFSAAGGGGHNPTGDFPISALTAAGLTIEQVSALQWSGNTGYGSGTAVIAKKDASTATVTYTTQSDFASVELGNDPSQLISTDGTVIINFTNCVNVGDII